MIGGSAKLDPNGGAAPLLALLRCIECSSKEQLALIGDGGAEVLLCSACQARYLVERGIPRMLPPALRRSPDHGRTVGPTDPRIRQKRRTAESFGFEWRRFRSLRPQWRANFLDYMRPHGPDFFRGKLVLDAGAGMGRHAYYAASFGARVVALDIGPAIDIAAENTGPSGSVLAVQGDIDVPPLRPSSFDLVYAIGVLHHLTDPLGGLRALVALAKPGAEVRIYVYSDLRESPLKRALLPLVDGLRIVTVRLPHWLLYLLSYPIALVGTLAFVWPAGILRRWPITRRLALALPLAAYADYPFMVCVNDQFDRFSAPIERRYGEEQVREWLRSAGLEDVRVEWHYGWIGTGRRPRTS